MFDGLETDFLTIPAETTVPADHPARLLNEKDRQDAKRYLVALDQHFARHGRDGWFGHTYPLRGCDAACLLYGGPNGNGSRKDDERSAAMLALSLYHIDGRCNGYVKNVTSTLQHAVAWNNDPSTTFDMVRDRVKQGIAVLDSLEGE